MFRRQVAGMAVLDLYQRLDLVRIHGLNNGLIIYSRPASGVDKYGHLFMVSPPLKTAEGEIDELLSRLCDTLRDSSAELAGTAPFYRSQT